MSGLLAACGDKEPEQRKAFVGFLQTRVLDKPGVHVPDLTAEEQTAFGPYTKHWAVIADFHRTMNGSIGPKMADAVRRGAFRSLDEIVARRADIRALAGAMDDVAVALKGAVATSDAAHAALNEPGDLKPVYDASYTRLVTTPAEAFAAVVPTFDAAMAATGKLADYIDGHTAQVKIVGGALQVSDPRAQSDLAALVHDLQGQQAAMTAAQARVQAAVYGGP